MAKTILESGQAAGEPEVYSSHLLAVMVSNGSDQTVMIQVADKNADLTQEASWTNYVQLREPNQNNPGRRCGRIETSKGFAVRAKVEGNGDPACVVIADILNEPHEQIKSALE